MKKPLIASSLTLAIFLSPLTTNANSWDFSEDPSMTQEQKQQKFEERKSNVIKRMEQGKKELIKRIDSRIECAKSADTPKKMRACHRAYPINLKKVHKEAFE